MRKNDLYLFAGDLQMKKLLSVFLISGILITGAFAQDLNGVTDGVEAIMTGITQDIAPNLQMIALSGNIVGDATIDHYMFYIPSLGFSFSDGLGNIMRPGAKQWDQVNFPELIDKKMGSGSTQDTIHAIESKIFAYPAMKIGFGMGFMNDMDFIVSGMYFPKAISEAAIGQAGEPISKIGLSFDAMNFGIEVRKSFLKDANHIPALSFGLLYNYGGFNMNLNNFSLSDLVKEGIQISGQSLNLAGSINSSYSVHNFGFDLHTSKHLGFFTPYAKFSEVYQYAIATTDTNMKATLGDSFTVNIKGKPEVVISDFSSLFTLGYEINCKIFILNSNTMIDLGRAKLDISNFSLSGITTRGFTVNTGIRWQF